VPGALLRELGKGSFCESERAVFLAARYGTICDLLLKTLQTLHFEAKILAGSALSTRCFVLPQLSSLVCFRQLDATFPPFRPPTNLRPTIHDNMSIFSNLNKPAGQSIFGGANNAGNTASTGGGLFGQSQQQPTAFGQTNTGTFGQSNTGAFGQTNTGAFGQSNTGAFGQSGINVSFP
jgi:hypothetical protein